MLRAPLIWLAAALSGAAALAYEIAWSRALVVPLGNSTDAAALVLAGFMLGIALGARWGGGLAERREPLRFYALLELGLAGWALVAPKILASLVWLPPELGSEMGALLRYLGAMAAITGPCLLMGASLPLLMRALTPPGAALGQQIGLAYGANTLGAATGAVAAAFWAVPTFGGWGCSALAAVGSALGAALALAAARMSREAPSEPAAAAAGVDAIGASQRRRRRLALGAAFVSGAAMLASEMLWTRVLTFVFGHDTYAFASLLAIVLVAVGLGSLAHRALLRLERARLVGWLLSLFALSLLVSFWVAAELVIARGRDPFAVATWGGLATSSWLELYRELSFTPVLVAAPAFLAGVTFPACCSLHAEGAEDAGRRVGQVLLANGVGSALGALAGAFGLVPLAGIEGAFVVVALTVAVVASVTLMASAPKASGRRWAILPAAAVAALVVAMPPALPRSMLLGVVGPRHQTLLHYEEARTSTVSVIESQIHGERQLLINSVNEVTTRLVHDQSFKLLGHLGPLLHPSPARAVMICLGAGISAGAALTHPLDSLDVVDLSAAVAHGARRFGSHNNGVLDHPNLHLHIADGRHYLLDSAGGYDLAIIDSTHPKAVDSWILYTEEFYRLVEARLAPGGVAVQWLPLHGLSENEFKIVVATFVAAFEHATLWTTVGFETYGLVAYAKLVGRKGGPLEIDLERLEQRLNAPAVAADLKPWGMDRPEAIVDQLVARGEALRSWTQGLPIQTDDHPIVPYTTAYSRGRAMVPPLLLGVREPLEALLGHAEGGHAPPDEVLFRAHHAQGLVLAGMLDQAAAVWPEGRKLELYRAQVATSVPYYRALAGRYGDDAAALFDIGTQLGSLGHGVEARDVLQRGLALAPDDPRIQSNLALVELDLGDSAAAVERLAALRRSHPRSAVTLHNLGVATMAHGEVGVARLHLEQALERDPHSEGVALALAQAYLQLDELERAEATLERVIDANPWSAVAQDLLGLVAARRGEVDRAVAQHRRAVALYPYSRAFLHNLGLALRLAGRDGEAERAFRRALALEPSDAPSLNELGLIEAGRERFAEAAELHLQALDVDPGFALAAHNLGLALRQSGNLPGATGAFCLALRIDPQLNAARGELASLNASADDCR